MVFILTLSLNICDTIAHILICDTLAERRFTKAKFIMIWVIKITINIVVLSIVPWQTSSFIKTIFAIGTLIISVFVSFKVSLIKSFFVSIISYAMFFSVEGLALFISTAVLGISAQALSESVPYYIFAATTSKIFIFSLSWIFKKLFSEKCKIEKLSAWQWIRILIVPMCTIVISSINSSSVISKDNNNIGFAVIAFGFVIINLVMMFLVEQVESEQKARGEFLAMQYDSNLRMENTDALIKAYESQRRLTHDFKNHLTVINNLLLQGGSAEATKYLNSLNADFDTSLVVDTNDAVINAILNEKYNTAKAKNITMRFKTNNLSPFQMDRKDFVTVLSNLLDNAIEACDKLETDKIIIVKLIYDKTAKTILSVRNTSLPVEISGNTISSSKSDKYSHGFGLKNVCRILQNNEADYSLDYSDGWFQFVVFL